MSDILSSHPWISQQDKITLEKIVDKIKECELTTQIVVDWFSNFSNEEQYKLALKIFFLIDYRTNKKSIDAIKIYKKQIEQAMFKLNRNNIVLVSSNRHDDSSNRFIYDIAKNWGLSESNISRKSELKDDVITNKNNFFIFFNDTHGTGNQFVTEFKEIVLKIKEENCAIISITMTNTAIERFQNEFPNIALIQPSFQSTKNIYKYQDENSLTSSDIELLKKLGGDVYSKGILGYKDSALLIAYSHQCPNNTLPIIWANGENNEVEGKAYPWNPLFEYKKIKEKKVSKTEEQQQEERNLTILPPINPDFIGRKNELEEIEKNLTANNLIYIVNGIGGVGKSELSYEYFHKHKDEYKKIAFIELSSEISIEEAFIIKFKEKFQLDSFEAIVRRLQEFPTKNLFLIDNLENREDFEKIKVLNTNFDLLFTTRLKDIDTKHQLNLETLTKEDAQKLFVSIYDTDENIEDILDYLDNHPLFINLTAKSLQREYLTLAELREEIKNNTLVKIDSKDDKTFQEHLHKRFNAQFEKETNQELKILLQKLAIFPSIEIDFEIFSKLLNIKKVELQKLVDRGWLTQKENQYKLHQIIKTFILSEYPLEYEEIIPIFQTVATYIDPYDSILVANLLNNYIPIIESFLSLYATKQDRYIAGLLDSLTFLYYSLANYDKSLTIQNDSKQIKENMEEPNNAYIAQSYHLLGIIYASKADYEQALVWSEKALDIQEKVLGTNHPDTAKTYNNIASVYDSKGKYEEALEWYGKALVIDENILDINYPDMATTYNNIASVYNSTGKYEEALKWYKKALVIDENIFATNHPHTARTYNNIASVYDATGKYDEALQLYEKALDIQERVLVINHPNTATTYNNIALVYKSKGKYEEALQWYKKALVIDENVLGDNHPDTAITYNNIAYAYKALKLCNNANHFFQKALDIYRQTDYNQNQIFKINNQIKEIKILQGKEKKTKFKDKGRFCKDEKLYVDNNKNLKVEK
ncbi:MAG: tetratricopeptide repeat protein [Arcobacteraceae bacterium]|nr:tetratricopeptide repeat protein [Arcobacteraceae bacterium]